MKTIMSLLAAILLLVACSKKDTTTPAPAPTPPDTLGVGWTRVILPGSQSSFQDIVFIDPSTGYLLDPERLYKSIDGGLNWQKIYDCPNNSNFLAATSAGVYLITKFDSVVASFDGGVTFNSTKLVGATNQAVDLYFPNKDTGYIPAGTNALFRTTDAGRNWSKISPINGLNISSLGRTVPYFIDGNKGWIADNLNVYYSSGSTNTWIAARGIPPTQGFISLAGVNSSIVYAGVSQAASTVYKSIDGGVTFSPTAPIPQVYANYFDVHFTSVDTGWVSGSRNIYQTTDGGASWTRVVRLGSGAVAEIHFTDSNHGWACCDDGSVLIYKR